MTKENNEKNNDGGGRLAPGRRFPAGPTRDRSAPASTVAASVMPLGNVDDEGHHADHQQRRRFAKRVRHADNGAGHDAGHRQRQHMVENGLLVRGADPQRRFLDGRRHRLQRGARGDDDGGQHQQRQHKAAHQRSRARQAEEIQEHRKAKQAEDDGGNRREIVDVDLDKIGQPVLGGEFLEIDCCANANRQAEDQCHQRVSIEPVSAAADAGELRLRANRRK